jgi:hypothetical protein
MNETKAISNNLVEIPKHQLLSKQSFSSIPKIPTPTQDSSLHRNKKVSEIDRDYFNKKLIRQNGNDNLVEFRPIPSLSHEYISRPRQKKFVVINDDNFENENDHQIERIELPKTNIISSKIFQPTSRKIAAPDEILNLRCCHSVINLKINQIQVF